MDAFYQQKSRRKNLIILSLLLFIVVMYLGFRIIRDSFFDTCTQSFSRTPESVILNYVNAIESGDIQTAQRCWDKTAYFELKNGCSEICITRILGTAYDIEIRSISDPILVDGRSRINISFSVSCFNTNDTYEGIIILDSLQRDYSWKHWKIVFSDLGGQLSNPWCR